MSKSEDKAVSRAKFITTPVALKYLGLSPQEVSIFSLIIGLSTTRPCWANNEFFANSENVSKKRISEIISSLNAKGFIINEQNARAGRKLHVVKSKILEMLKDSDHDLEFLAKVVDSFPIGSIPKKRDTLELKVDGKSVGKGGITPTLSTEQTLPRHPENGGAYNNYNKANNKGGDLAIPKPEIPCLNTSSSLLDSINPSKKKKQFGDNKPRTRVKSIDKFTAINKEFASRYRNEELGEKLKAYLDLRRKKGLTDLQWKIMLDDLEHYSDKKVSTMIDYLNTAISGGFYVLIPSWVKEPKASSRYGNRPFDTAKPVTTIAAKDLSREDFLASLAKDEHGNLLVF